MERRAHDEIHLVGQAETVAANLQQLAGGDQRLQLALERGALLARNPEDLGELASGCGMMNAVADQLKELKNRDHYATRITCKSPTFVAVGPVRIKSPSLSKNT